jgi:hypothetical protein
VLTAICVALVGGFVASIRGPDQGSVGQVAGSPAACRAPTC